MSGKGVGTCFLKLAVFRKSATSSARPSTRASRAPDVRGILLKRGGHLGETSPSSHQIYKKPIGVAALVPPVNHMSQLVPRLRDSFAPERRNQLAMGDCFPAVSLNTDIALPFLFRRTLLIHTTTLVERSLWLLLYGDHTQMTCFEVGVCYTVPIEGCRCFRESFPT